MTTPTLGQLAEVNLREAWDHEAHSFTPWLADHLDILSKEIGIPLEFEGREVYVDTFSADILARNTNDDTLVLIENQLEGTDHTHLGQIITYLSGLGAHTVVWIAADFREAHLSALKWLNEHTAESFAFFAVKVSAVRIDSSPIAPIFEVLNRPNHWERKLQSIARESGQMSPLGQFRKEFWTHYVTRFPHELEHEAAKGVSSRWRCLTDIDLAISLYLGKEEVGIFVRGPEKNANGQDVIEGLIPYAEKLSERLGVSWRQSEKGYFFANSHKAQTDNRELWDELTDWLHNEADRYETALNEIVGSQIYRPNQAELSSSSTISSELAAAR